MRAHANLCLLLDTGSYLKDRVMEELFIFKLLSIELTIEKISVYLIVLCIDVMTNWCNCLIISFLLP